MAEAMMHGEETLKYIGGKHGHRPASSRNRWCHGGAWIGLGADLLVLQTVRSFGPFALSLPAMVATMLVVYFGVAGAGAKVDAA